MHLVSQWVHPDDRTKRGTRWFDVWSPGMWGEGRVPQGAGPAELPPGVGPWSWPGVRGLSEPSTPLPGLNPRQGGEMLPDRACPGAAPGEGIEAAPRAHPNPRWREDRASSAW